MVNAHVPLLMAILMAIELGRLPLASCLEAPSPDQPGTPRRRSKPRTTSAAQLQLQTTSAQPSVSTHARSTTTSSRPCGQPERLPPPDVALLADPSSASIQQRQLGLVGPLGPTWKISIIKYLIIHLIDRNWLICKKIIFLAPKWINTLHECVYQILSENNKKRNWYSAK